nr:MAG TPA: hypothetical protein [Herelleviridae sp.]
MNNIEELITQLKAKHRCIKDIKFIAYYDEPAFVLLVKLRWYSFLLDRNLFVSILLLEISKMVEEPIKFDIVFV